MRRNLLAIAAGVLVAGVNGPSSSPTSTPSGEKPAASLKVSLPGLKPAFSQSDIAVAEANGFFKEQNLTVTTQGLASGVQTVQSVVAGDCDIGGSSIEPVANAAEEGGLVIIGSYADRLPVVMETSSKITTPAQLRGKALGIQSVGAFREVMTRAVYESAGLHQSEVQYVPVADTGYVSALVTGKIQSAILQQEQSVEAEKQSPDLHVLAELFKIWPDYFYGTYFVKTDWLRTHREVAIRFLTAITKAHRLIYSDRAKVVPQIAAVTGFSTDVIDKAYDRLIAKDGIFAVNEGLDAKRLNYTLTKMKESGTLTAASPFLSKIVDRGPLQTVVQQLGPLKGDPRWH